MLLYPCAVAVRCQDLPKTGCDMETVKLSSKGQIVIPKNMRDELN